MAYASIVGDMAVVKSIFVWSIDSSVLVNKNSSELLCSPCFIANDSRWELSLHTKEYVGDCDKYVTFVLKKLSPAKGKESIVVLSFVDNQNKSCFSRMECVPANDGRYYWELEKFVKYNDLIVNLQQLSTEGKLKLKCEMFPKLDMLDSMFTLPNFISSFNDEKFSDVCFVIGDEKLHAHKVILVNRSEVFSAMFEHTMKENLENVVYIEDIDYNTFVEMLRFIYSGKVNDITNIAENLLAAADKYALFDLKFVCGECLCDKLTEDNVFELLELADRHNVAPLKNKALHFIVFNSPYLISNPKFRNITNLSKDLLFDVIHSFALEKLHSIQNLVADVDMRESPESPEPSLRSSVPSPHSPAFSSHSPSHSPASPPYEIRF